MKKLVIDNKIKLVDESVEDILEKKQTVVDIAETSTIIETVISAENAYSFSSPAGKGMKTLRIISDVPITFSYTSQANTYSLPVKLKEIQFVTNGENKDTSIDWIASYGSVTLTNTSTEDVAHIKIIFTY